MYTSPEGHVVVAAVAHCLHAKKINKLKYNLKNKNKRLKSMKNEGMLHGTESEFGL